MLSRRKEEVDKLNSKLFEIEGMNSKIGGLQDKINKLVHENTSYSDEIRNAQ